MPAEVNNQSTKPLMPPVYWAQRKNLVYVNIAVEDCKDPVINIEKDKIYYKGNGGTDKKNYEVTLDLFDEIDLEKSRKIVRDRGTELILIKKEENSPYWKRLLKDNRKLHWLKVDFNKWKDEDESGDEGAGGGADFEEMMRQMGGLGAGGMGPGGDTELDLDDADEEDEEEDSLPPLE